MSNLVVITFADPDEAAKLHDTLQSGQKAGYISLEDMAVITKDEEGEVHVTNEVDRGVKVGAVGGGLLGLLIAGIFFPIGGLVLRCWRCLDRQNGGPRSGHQDDRGC